MLFKAAETVQECFDRAARAAEKAAATGDPKMKDYYRDMELRWLRLADNYMFIEQVERFLGDRVSKRHRADWDDAEAPG